MSYDPEDEEGWNALATFPDDQEDSCLGSIGPLDAGSGTYTYALNNSQRQLSISAQPEKGLSFQIWPSALSLAKYAELKETAQRGYWKGKKVVELGAGCGLVGLVFAALGAKVLLTDLPTVLSLLKANIVFNEDVIRAGGGSADCCELTWGVTPVESLGQAWAGPDFVVAADVVYHRELFDPLLASLTALGGQAMLLAHVRRWKSDAVFFKHLKKHFLVEDITSKLDKDAAQLDSHTRGAPRLFTLTQK